MITLQINVTKMFADVDPCYVSGSVAELGPAAGQITWSNALELASEPSWLESDVADADEAARDWARWTGAWTRDEIDAWTREEALALLAQNIASDIRSTGVDAIDDYALGTLVEHQETSGYYYRMGGELMCDWYNGI